MPFSLVFEPINICLRERERGADFIMPRSRAPRYYREAHFLTCAHALSVRLLGVVPSVCIIYIMHLCMCMCTHSGREALITIEFRGGDDFD